MNNLDYLPFKILSLGKGRPRPDFFLEPETATSPFAFPLVPLFVVLRFNHRTTPS